MRKISKNLATTISKNKKGKGEDERRKHSDASRNFCHAASNFTNTPPLGLEEKIKWTFNVKTYLEHILWNSLLDWKTGKRSFVKTFVLLEPRLTRSDWCPLNSYFLAAQFFAGKRMLFGITLITSPTFSLLQLKSDWRCKGQNEDECEDQPNRV